MPYPPFDTQWKTWRVVTASDSAFISDYKPASFDSELAIASQPNPLLPLERSARTLTTRRPTLKLVAG